MKSFFWYPTWNRAKQDEGIEHLLLDDFSATGRISAFDALGEAFQCTYELRWDGNWFTREVHVMVAAERWTRRLSLYSEKEGVWRNSMGHHLSELDGCLDVILWPTPFTTTLPISRLRLAPGERKNIRAVHILAPELEVQAVRQAYTCLKNRLYLYEGLDTGSRKEIEVDEHNLVLDYPGFFRRFGWKDN